MSIKRYIASKDNTITNAFTSNLTTRGTGSNMGAADILEVFSLYGQGDTTSSVELSRALLQFPVDKISADRTAGTIPGSGSVSFYLRIFNARHSEQLPKNCTMNVLAVSQSWQEGYGLDMEGYTDKTKDSISGSNWINRAIKTSWEKIGGDYHSSSYVSGTTMPNYKVTFENGDEDLLLDVTAAIEEWIAGKHVNYGFGVFLTSSHEAQYSSSASPPVDTDVLIHNPNGQTTSFYTKRFFSRTSEFFFKRPNIEARWDSRIKDDRGNFYASSSVAPVSDNLNNLYLYNYIRGVLKDIPHTNSPNNETLTVKLYASSDDIPVGPALGTATATKYDTGIYKASIALETTSSILHDIWSGSVGGEYKTGSIKVKSFSDVCVLTSNDYNQFTTKITNLKPSYSSRETAKFRVYSRLRNYSPTIYTVASAAAENTIIPSSSYQISRTVDGKSIVDHATSSSETTYHTFLSYDASGSYFDLNMNLLEPGYMYNIKLAYYTSDGWRDQEEVFKFRVEDN